jgi:very-short-patch-repair endonuclease
VKYSTPEDLLAEKRRQESLEQAGWRVVRWDWNEGVVQPHLMVARLAAALNS